MDLLKIDTSKVSLNDFTKRISEIVHNCGMKKIQAKNKILFEAVDKGGAGVNEFFEKIQADEKIEEMFYDDLMEVLKCRSDEALVASVYCLVQYYIEGRESFIYKKTAVCLSKLYDDEYKLLVMLWHEYNKVSEETETHEHQTRHAHMWENTKKKMQEEFPQLSDYDKKALIESLRSDGLIGPSSDKTDGYLDVRHDGEVTTITKQAFAAVAHQQAFKGD